MNVKRFRGGLELKARRLLYHSTLGSRVIEKKRRLGFRVWFEVLELRAGFKVYGCLGFSVSERGA